jgi:hypothetical protein
MPGRRTADLGAVRGIEISGPPLRALRAEEIVKRRLTFHAVRLAPN